jgi:TIR domain
VAESTAPKVFVSHASEDKDRFVVAFAERLRRDGVDAWLDRWEMAPGDSLVARIFDEGIGGADVFLVVLSDNSIDKSWVREELNVGLVQRIEGACKLVPVVLDGVTVPIALKATVWQPIGNASSYDAEYQRILGAIFGVSDRPMLGEPPAYATSKPLPGLTPSDSLVLAALVEAAIDSGSRLVSGDDLRSRCAATGLDDAAVLESVYALDSHALVDEVRLLQGRRVVYVTVGWSGVLTLLAQSRPEMGDVQRSLVAHLVNDPAESFDLRELAEREGVAQILSEALLTPYESRGLLKMAHYAGGQVSVRTVSPLLRREMD